MQENILYTKELLATALQDHMSFKALGSVFFAIGTFLFAGLSSKALLALLILIVVDYAVAIFQARRSGKMITAKESLRTPVKILVYYTMIACGHLVEYGIPASIQFLDDTILTFLLITEFLSILKHFSNLGYKTPTKLINNLREEIGETNTLSQEAN